MTDHNGGSLFAQAVVRPGEGGRLLERKAAAWEGEHAASFEKDHGVTTIGELLTARHFGSRLLGALGDSSSTGGHLAEP